MLIIDVKNGEPIDKALRLYKRKVNSTRQMKQLRDRKQFTKPSIKRRHEKLAAIHREKRQRDLEV